MSVAMTVDDMLETAGTTIVIAPERAMHDAAPAKQSVTRLKVLARARSRTDRTVETAAAAPAAEPMTQRRVLSLATPIIGENLLQTLVGASPLNMAI